MKEKEISFIQDQIGYRFKNPAVLEQAFTRRSFSMENGGQNNEVLEFIGDKVLDFIVVKLLAEKNGHFSEKYSDSRQWGKIEEKGTFISYLDEGGLTEAKKKLVQKSTLSDAVDNLGLEPYIIMGKGDAERGIQNAPSVKEDLFEAILGAVALDSDWNIATLQDCVNIMLNPDVVLQEDEINYVAEIQLWTLNHSGKIPFHRFEHWTQQASWYFPKHPLCIYGTPDEDTQFMCETQFPGVEKHFVGYGKSKSQARADACRLAYEYLDENGLLPTIRDEIENPNLDDAISQLEILARRDWFPLPTYQFGETYDKDGNPIWNCECHIEGIELVTSAESSSKKTAKKRAAFEMLQHVLKE
ncbi:MAG: hypothetical protein J5795_03500 [Lachnospiraceae bacterium]|nr:hypothetical protein [Lachnospiraceae bacterium]